MSPPPSQPQLKKRRTGAPQNHIYTVCQQVFEHNFNLQQHRSTHGPHHERQFACTYCSPRFEPAQERDRKKLSRMKRLLWSKKKWRSNKNLLYRPESEQEKTSKQFTIVMYVHLPQIEDILQNNI